jgi:hypothetical protein
MSQIPPIDYQSASAEIRTAHDDEVIARGRMTNMKRVLLHSPTAHRIYAEWFALREELRPAISDREIWLLCLSISTACCSIIPVGFFRRALFNAGLTPESIEPTDTEALLMAFGKAIVGNSNAVPQPIWDDLKARYDAPTLVNLVAFAGIMIATAIVNNVIDVDIDPELLPYLQGVDLAAGG